MEKRVKQSPFTTVNNDIIRNVIKDHENFYPPDEFIEIITVESLTGRIAIFTVHQRTFCNLIIVKVFNFLEG